MPFITDPALLQQYQQNQNPGGAKRPPGAKPLLKGEQPQEMGAADYALDTAMGAVGGVGKAINETSDLVYSGANWADNALGADILPEENPFVLPEYKPKSIAGDIAKGVTEFATGFVGAGKFMKAFNIAQGLGKAGKLGAFAKSSLQGALADFVAFDPHEGRFSNLLQDMGVKNEFIDFLAADKADGEALGRFKNAVEGLALGAATEPVIMLASAIKNARGALKEGGETAAARVVTEASQSLEDVLAGKVKSSHLPIKPGEEALGQPVHILEGDLKGTVTARNGDGTLEVKFIDQDGQEATKAFREEKLAGQIDKRPRFQPKEKVEVYSTGDRKVRAVEADEHGFVELKEGERFVVERHNPKSLDVPVDTEKLTRSIKEALVKGDQEGVYRAITDAVNLEHMQSGDDVLQTISNIVDSVRDSWDDGVWKHVELSKEAQGLADTLGIDNANILGRSLIKDSQTMREATIRMVAAKALTQKMALEVNTLARRININPTKADEVRLIELLKTAGTLVDGIKMVGKEGARMTSAGNVKTFPSHNIEGLSLKDMQEAIDAAGGERRLLQVAQELARTSDPKAVFNTAIQTKWGKFFDMHNEFLINNWLSGPKTSVVNMTSNLVNTIAMPMDRIVGGLITGDAGAVKEGLRLYSGLTMYVKDSIGLAWQALKMSESEIARRGGNSFLDAGKGSLDVSAQKITSKNLNMDRDTFLGQAVDYLGTMMRLPSRFLGAQDEFFKQLNYRAKAYSDLVAQAMDVKGIKDKQGIAMYVADEFHKMFDPAGGGTYEKALDYARYATFTKDLEYGFGRWLQSGAARFPALRVIVPFIRTPVNIFRQAWQMTPGLNRLQKQFAADLASTDPVVVAAARGREALGGLLWSSAILAASQGHLTGGGPKDPAMRERWLEAGNQPYSIVFRNEDGTKSFVQLSRIDPFAMCLGIAADYADAAKYMREEDMTKMSTAMFTALTRNITSKSYLKGLIDWVQLVNDPARFGEKYVQRMVSSYVPYSGALGQVRQETDDPMREVRTVADAIINKVPGMSDKLPAKRSWVTGQPVLYGDADAGGIPDFLNPFALKKSEQNMVLEELAKLQHGIQAPQERIGNIELTSDQYARYKELHGTIRLNNRTLMESLERLMKSDRYDIQRKRVPDGPDEYTDHRLSSVKQVVEQYRRAAQLALLKEDPALHQAYVTDRRNSRMAKRGKYEELQSLF